MTPPSLTTLIRAGRGALACMLLGACSIVASDPPTPWPTATTVSVSTATAPPTSPTPASAAPTEDVAALALASVIPACTDDGEGAPAQHRVVANVDYAGRALAVTQQITYRNRTGVPLGDLLLNVEPNRWLAAFTLDGLTVDGVPAGYDLTGRALRVPLPAPLEPACQVRLMLSFRLDVPPIASGVEAYRGYFGHSPRQINLGHWLPVVVPYIDGAWLQHESVFVGEQIVLEPADWDVAFVVLGAVPPRFAIAAPGSVTQPRPDTWRFVHTAGRDFAASLSTVFIQRNADAADGTRVEVYALPDALSLNAEGVLIDGAQFAADAAAASLDSFSARFGTYGRERLVIVQGDFPDGMEFSALGFVGTQWFVAYDGEPTGYLLLITVHEVAHQWWYDQVGNDQALAPWLDEALSTYSELVMLQDAMPELVDWWWGFRVNRLNPDGYVDSTVYDFDAIRPYINAVYLRGVMLLHALRNDLGDEAFFAWLRAYAEAGRGQVVDASLLWSLLSEEQLDATAFTRSAFLRHPA